MAALVVFLLTAPTSFAAGWVLRGHRNRTKGKLMNARIRTLVGRFVDWLADPRKLVAASVVVGLLAASAIVYTWTADQQSEDRTDDVMTCIAHYVSEQSKAQAPRTLAANVASDARRDWDRGFSDDLPGATDVELKDRYLALYAAAELVRETNPLPEFTQEFCREALR